ncbi:MAG: hypothetical protein CM1200mP2_43240 [Planctomycetaceae bacterium]|nr:MAG: hypothetical protein CM1200mP2_43240 [Planctomycetaceae bacterium]
MRARVPGFGFGVASDPDQRGTGSLRSLDYDGWTTRTVDITFDRSEGAEGLQPALEGVCGEVEAAIDAGDSFVVLSDRRSGGDRVPISSLLACGAVHHHLVRNELRTRIGLVLESGEAREVHHHCLLVG